MNHVWRTAKTNKRKKGAWANQSTGRRTQNLHPLPKDLTEKKPYGKNKATKKPILTGPPEFTHISSNNRNLQIQAASDRLFTVRDYRHRRKRGPLLLQLLLFKSPAEWHLDTWGRRSQGRTRCTCAAERQRITTTRACNRVPRYRSLPLLALASRIILSFWWNLWILMTTGLGL